ncbi:lasso RiPP family leader peptide-containing protein [Actinomycetota bacterium Odt1-20B]
MEEQAPKEFSVVYEPPALVEVGDFSEDTLGFGTKSFDSYGKNIF